MLRKVSKLHETWNVMEGLPKYGSVRKSHRTSTLRKRTRPVCLAIIKPRGPSSWRRTLKRHRGSIRLCSLIQATCHSNDYIAKRCWKNGRLLFHNLTLSIPYVCYNHFWGWCHGALLIVEATNHHPQLWSLAVLLLESWSRKVKIIHWVLPNHLIPSF